MFKVSGPANCVTEGSSFIYIGRKRKEKKEETKEGKEGRKKKERENKKKERET